MRVALAEDGALFREGLQMLLQAAGHEVVAVADLTEPRGAVDRNSARFPRTADGVGFDYAALHGLRLHEGLALDELTGLALFANDNGQRLASAPERWLEPVGAGFMAEPLLRPLATRQLG